jgi:LacI family transcriptional regulator
MGAMNIIKLAKELNLSISTVSKALKDSYEISAATKQRVIELAEKYNYKPNPFASVLRSGKSKSIAIIIPEIASHFFSVAVDAIQTMATEKGYDVFVYVTHENLSNEISVLKRLEISLVDGVIMSLCSQTKSYNHILEFYNNTGLPIVFFDRIAMMEQFPRIVTNNYEIAFQATEHLVESGSKKIVYLCSSEWMYINKERQRGFTDAAKKNHLSIFDDSTFINCFDDADQNYTIIHQLLLSKNRPDAILASVEKLALIVYHVARALDINIPNDLKVISFSNLRAASLLKPSLSTISQPAYEMGEQSVKLLFKMIEKKFYKNANDIITINSKIAIRDSTKKTNI